jgi:hypothetical protein
LLSPITHPLAHICNYSLYTGDFLGNLKVSLVKSLHRKGDKICMTNCRPVSVLTTFSEVLEKVMYDWLSHRMYIEYNILVQEKFGFRKGISTEVVAFKLTDKVLKSINKKCMLEEFSVVLQRLSTVQIMTFC